MRGASVRAISSALIRAVDAEGARGCGLVAPDGREEEQGGEEGEDQRAQGDEELHRVSAYTTMLTPKRVLSSAWKRLLRGW
jgi:hypothetical protein